MIAFSTLSGHCQDRGENSAPGFRVRIFPIPRSLVQSPMPISFNGMSELGYNLKSFSGVSTKQRMVPDSFSRLSPLGLTRGLTHIKAYLRHYLNLPDLNSNQATLNAYPLASEHKIQEDRLSLEFQADVSDLSGALLFVLKI
ncbi:MAG: hypothetical protein HUK40_23125 [Desulfobacter sp.]|nr:hypothetical protein [Desulfobacter sp.]WDP86090.1 MAG: hypothetical protein HUN05_13940 [Desulfobacter sp.]